MAFEYKQNQWNHAPIDPLLCKAYISNRERWAGGHQCSRKSVKDGWCSQHHPDKEAERLRKADERYKLKRENSVGAKLDRARDRIEELVGICKLARKALYHIAPDDCWAFGPEDNSCPGCRTISQIDLAIGKEE